MEGMKSLADIFGEIPQKPKKRTSERAELLRYFIERIRDKNNKLLTPARVGVLLSIYSLQDLYTFKSILEDCSRTQIGFNWQKQFWGRIKVKK